MTETTTLDLHPNTAHVLDLPGMATSGYSWGFNLSEPDVVQISHEYIAPTHSKPGARGIERFTINALQSGGCVLELKQIRSWEKDQPPINTRSIKINVK